MKRFDYESKTWGVNTVSSAPTELGALRLKYCLEALKGVRGKILDVGCGAGGFTKAIKRSRPDLEVWGVDISVNSVRRARKNPQRVNFSLGSAYKLPFKDNSFDAVVLFDVIEHLDKPDKSLREIYRTLKKGGLFHCFVPTEGEIFAYTKWLNNLGWRAKEKYAGHIQNFTKDVLVNVLGKEKLKVIDTKWSGHFLYQAADAVYFTILLLRGKNIGFGVESLVSLRKKTLLFRMLGLMSGAVAIGSFIESSLFQKIPGFGVHLTAKKL